MTETLPREKREELRRLCDRLKEIRELSPELAALVGKILKAAEDET